mgnify:CR=1 FL=1
MELAPLILLSVGAIQATRKTLDTARRIPAWDRVLSKVWVGSIVVFLVAQVSWFRALGHWYGEAIYLILLYTVWLLRDYRPARLLTVALLPYAVIYVVNHTLRFLFPSFFDTYHEYFDSASTFSVLWLLGFGIYATVQNNKERKVRQKEEERIRQAEARRAELEHLVAERTDELMREKEVLEKTLTELKATQVQLVHSEKMASLGELTAGIAHEIQNPLNFVNNFSELSVELAEELKVEIGKLEIPEKDREYIAEILGDLTQNQEKINHHGKRASNIVTSMLQHSRTGTGKKEPTDVNALADEYLRLAYHGLRAKDKSFNAKMVADLDPNLGKIDAVPQDLGRVLLNLINNAFYAVTQRKRDLAQPDLPGVQNLEGAAAYEPTVTVTSRLLPSGQAEIRIRDNGTGIPESLKAKIFQPFFTTKPTGQGTGLGLSLAYDIVTKGHGGTLEVESVEGKGTEFVIRLPVKTAGDKQ